MSAPPPGSPEPEPRPAPAAPAACEGLQVFTQLDWFDVQLNLKELIKGNKYKRVLGFTSKIGLNLRTEIVKGWAHSTVIGGAITQVVGWENKFNGAAQINFINVRKSETTRGEKKEVLLVGFKIQSVGGTAKKFEGSNKTENNVNTKAKLTNKKNELWSTVEKRLAQALEETTKDLSEQHDKLQAELNQVNAEIKSACERGDKYIGKCNAFIGDFRKARQECDSVEAKISSNCKILSDAAVDFNASNGYEVQVSGNKTVTAGSLISFAAALTKLG